MNTPQTDTETQVKAGAWPRRWRRMLQVGLALLTIIVLLIVALRLLAMSGAGRGFVEAQIENAAPAGQSIEITGLSGDLLGRFTMASLSVSDQKGVWLQAENIEARWTPLALVSRHARLDLLSADTIRVLRRPQLDTQASDTDSGGAMPVRRITLGSFSIAAIELAEGVAGPEARLSLEASLRHRPDGGELSARLQPESEAGDRLNADLFWGGPAPLSGALELEGPAGGLFATLARLDPGQALQISVDGAGAADDWSANTDIRIAGETALELTAAGAGEDARIEGRASLAPHPLTRDLVSRLGSSIGLTAEIAPGASGAPRLTARMNAETLDLRAAAPAGNGMPERIEVSARSEQPMRLIGSDAAGMDWLSLDGALLIAGEAFEYDGDLTLAGLNYGDTTLRRLAGPVTASLVAGESLHLVTELTARDVQLSTDAAPIDRAILAIDGQYGIEDGMIRLGGLRVEAPAIRLRASGETSLQGDGEGLRGTVSLDGPASGFAPVSLEGDWRLSGGSSSLQALFAGSVSDLPELPHPIAKWVDGRVDIDVSVTRLASGRLEADNLTLRAAGLRLSGSASMSESGSLALELGGQGDELHSDTYSSGPVQIALNADGTLDALRVRASAGSPLLAVTGEELRELDLGIAGVVRGRDISGQIEMGARIDGEPARLNSDFAVDSGQWSIRNTRLTWAGLSGTGEATAPLARPGALAGQLNVSGDLPDIIPAGRIDLEAEIRDQALAASGAIRSVNAGPLADIDLGFRVDGDLDALRYELEADGGTLRLAGIARDFSVNVDGTLERMAQGGALAAFAVRSGLDDLVLATDGPARLELSQTGLHGDIRLSGFNGTVDFSLRSQAGGRHITAQVEGVALAPLLLLAGQAPVEGTLAGGADIGFADEVLTGGFDLSAAGIKAHDGGSQPLELSLTGTAENGVLAMLARASDPSGLSLTARADIPSAWFIGSGRPPFNMLVSGGGQMDTLAGLFLPDETDLGGQVALDLSVPVPFTPAGLDGRIDLSAARLELGMLGLVLEEMQASAEIADGEIRLPAFSARDPDGGRLSGQGAYRFGGDNTLSLTADKLKIANRRTYRATASGQLHLDQTPAGYEIAGDLIIDRAQVDIEALPGSGLTTLDVRFPDGAGVPKTGEEPAGNVISLDVSVGAPGRIFVTGQGLDAEMALDATIEGPLSEPRLYGLAQIVRGRFDLAGKRFRFADSQISFNGDPMAGELDIQARRETESLTAVVSIAGTPRSPRISLGSQPELPEDEVLSRVLFGRSPAELSALETARLAAALAQLAGGGGGNLLGGLEDTLGLDRLDFGQDSSGASEVTTGKYIAENVYLEARTGASGTPKLVLEWEPIENIEVEGDITPSESQEFSIRWTRDFD